MAVLGGNLQPSDFAFPLKVTVGPFPGPTLYPKSTLYPSSGQQVVTPETPPAGLLPRASLYPAEDLYPNGVVVDHPKRFGRPTSTAVQVLHITGAFVATPVPTNGIEPVHSTGAVEPEYATGATGLNRSRGAEEILNNSAAVEVVF